MDSPSSPLSCSPIVYATSMMSFNMAARRPRLVLDAGGDLGRATNGCGEKQRPFFIGVAGGTASGKSTVCQKIVELLGEKDVEHRDRRVYVISQESFYRDLDENDRQLAKKGQFNFDHPAAFNYDLMESTLSNIWKAIPVDILQYDFVNHCRDVTKKKTINTADVILVEGILVFYFEGIRDMFDMKLFVDTDADTRLSRRVVRDIKEYGRPLDQILNQYTTFVKPAFEEFCLPTKKYADVIIPRGADNTVAIDLIVQHIQELLKHEHKHDLNLSAGSASSADSTRSALVRPLHGPGGLLGQNESGLNRPRKYKFRDEH